MRIVFVGAGAVFGWHAGQWMRYAREHFEPEFFVVEPDDGVAKLNPARHMTRLSIEEAWKIADLAIIMTPSHVRWEVCKGFVEKGTPLVVEKPLALAWEEINQFEKAGTWICPVVNARVLPKVERLKAAVVEWGQPVNIMSFKERWRDPNYYTGYRGKFAGDGGVLAQQGFHCLDLVVWIGGPVAYLKCRGTRDHHAIECEDTASAHIRFQSGSAGQVYCTTADPLNGDAGLEITFAPSDIRGTVGRTFQKGHSGHTILAKRVFQALADKQPPPITVESMIPSLRALHACYVSMDRNGEEVDYGEKHERLGVG